MEAFIGTIVLFGGNFCPRGWRYCDGTELKIMENQALFALIGTTYGGDGKTTFALPNLPIVKDTDGKGESRYIICLYGIFPERW